LSIGTKVTQFNFTLNDLKKFAKILQMIEVITRDDLDGVAECWADSLPLNIHTIIGKKIIKTYLNYFFESELNIGYKITTNAQIDGFVLYGNEKIINQKIIKKHFLEILISFFKNLFSFNLKKIFQYFDVFLFLIFSKNYEYLKKDIELISICVFKNKQNKGLGTKLIQNSLTKSNFASKYKKIYVQTLLSTPNNINFYKKNGFEQEKIIYGRIYLSKTL